MSPTGLFIGYEHPCYTKRSQVFAWLLMMKQSKSTSIYLIYGKRNTLVRRCPKNKNGKLTIRSYIVSPYEETIVMDTDMIVLQDPIVGGLF